MNQQPKMKNPDILRKPESSGKTGLQRTCARCGEKDAEKKRGILQRSAILDSPDHVPPCVLDVLREPGQPLDRETRAFMEPRFGQDFSRVRVHTDAQAARSARVVNAQAYTVGDDLVFGAGDYSPETANGRKLLAHSVRQSSGANAYPIRK